MPSRVPKWLLERYPLLSESELLYTGSQLSWADASSLKRLVNLENKVHTKEHKLALDLERLSRMSSTTLNKKVN